MSIQFLSGISVFLNGELFTSPVQVSARDASALHRHDFYEIFFLVSGELLHDVNGMCQHLQAGNAVLIRPEDSHTFDLYQGMECDFINIAFDSKVLDELETFYRCEQTRHLWQDQKMPCVDIYDTESDIWRRLIQQANSCMAVNQNQIDRRIRIKNLIAGLYSHFIQMLLRKELQPDVPFWLQTLCEHLSYPDQLAQGVKAIRSLTYYSYEYVSRCFQRYFHVTPTEYILNLRLSYAALQLSQTRRSVLDIAMDTGFISYSYFSRSFTLKYGLTPARYRRENSHLTV